MDSVPPSVLPVRVKVVAVSPFEVGPPPSLMPTRGLKAVEAMVRGFVVGSANELLEVNCVVFLSTGVVVNGPPPSLIPANRFEDVVA